MFWVRVPVPCFHVATNALSGWVARLGFASEAIDLWVVVRVEFPQTRIESPAVGNWGMEKPHLVILSDDADLILKGRCSSCEGITFSLSRSTESCLALMHGMFSEHFKQVHTRKDASQAAAPNETEATED
jgi:hypothetical protein